MGIANSRQALLPAVIFLGVGQMIINGHQKAQAVIEYALLVAIAIIALVATSNFVSRLKGNNSAFERHFEQASSMIGNVVITPY